MDNEEKAIIDFMRNHQGKDKAVTYKAIAFFTQIDERTVRSTVAHLVTEHNMPIGTISSGGNAGYFLISNADEFDQAHRELISRIKKLSARCKGLRRGYEKYVKKPEQMSLI